MAQPPPITEAEWQVMAVVWDRGPTTAAQVVEALAGRRRWSPRTVKTLLGRLLRKKALGHRPEGIRYVYFARVQREACIRRESRAFLNRIFEGDALSALVHLARAGNLTDEQLGRLRRLLREEDKP
jgi:BlaI family transcriptional regulator, penicillinase repressor